MYSEPHSEVIVGSAYGSRDNASFILPLSDKLAMAKQEAEKKEQAERERIRKEEEERLKKEVHEVEESEKQIHDHIKKDSKDFKDFHIHFLLFSLKLT